MVMQSGFDAAFKYLYVMCIISYTTGGVSAPIYTTVAPPPCGIIITPVLVN
jgi:hypothetical protein